MRSKFAGGCSPAGSVSELRPSRINATARPAFFPGGSSLTLPPGRFSYAPELSLSRRTVPPLVLPSIIEITSPSIIVTTLVELGVRMPEEVAGCPEPWFADLQSRLRGFISELSGCDGHLFLNRPSASDPLRPGNCAKRHSARNVQNCITQSFLRMPASACCSNCVRCRHSLHREIRYCCGSERPKKKPAAHSVSSKRDSAQPKDGHHLPFRPRPDIESGRNPTRFCAILNGF
jgi:hypothetical protein